MTTDEPLSAAALQELKADLIEIASSLEAALDIRREASKSQELDQARIGRLSRMDALQQTEMAKASKGNAERRLRLVKQALTRIENDSYGECQLCGEYISFRRLKVSPETALCIACQTERES